MFDRLKKALLADKRGDASSAGLTEVGSWAAGQDIRFVELGNGSGFGLSGEFAGKPWKLECIASSRDYISGEELRARVETRVKEEPAVIIMNRTLKNALEERAYGLYTDSLQTEARPGLLEEMRWMASYPEVGWETQPVEFWDRYSVMADRRSHAVDWVDDSLAKLLMRWPRQGQDATVPFMLMLLRGKVHLRMQYTPDCLPTLIHATHILQWAGYSAINGFSTETAP